MKQDKNKESRIIRKGELDPGKSIEWIPDATYDHADFSLPENGKKAERKERPKDRQEGASVSSWIPPKLESGGKIVAHREAIGGKKISSARIIRGSSSAGVESPPSQPENMVSVQLLREIIRAYPENSVYILRNWYFEKPDPSRVHPHQKIRTILSSAGMDILRFLFGMFSAVERANMAEILKASGVTDERTSDIIRREFMEKVKNYV